MVQRFIDLHSLRRWNNLHWARVDTFAAAASACISRSARSCSLTWATTASLGFSNGSEAIAARSRVRCRHFVATELRGHRPVAEDPAPGFAVGFMLTAHIPHMAVLRTTCKPLVNGEPREM
jgi:hypothetical protein